MASIVKTLRKFKRRLTPSKHLWPEQKLVESDMATYKRRMGYEFDINHPVSFTEKIQRYRLFYNNPILSEIVDKYSFKKYIEEKLGPGHTIPLLGVWNNIKELDAGWEKLPERFCLKSTISSSGYNILFIKDKSKTSYKEIRNIVKKWFDPKNTSMNGFNKCYFSCTPRVLAEEYKETVSGQLFDYKIFCFNGVPFCFYAACEHFDGNVNKDGYPIAFYNLKWEKMNVRYGNHRNDDIKQPIHMDKMIEYAKVLSEGFPFVRVDFFDTEEKLYLAEMTFFPGGGFTPYFPESFNKEMGDKLILPAK